ncbi:tRNA G18 (ribose-2'-O)-methylase SpoU [Kribbella amoyensis]|uniref:tRNA G18 (Ribose-2'-O)-methylase SpoU n=1 Tax=Kribbella amoyensis TaxID=996641 RepID=A0A561BYF2_9ACTN|nr:RNA methyltransferase [Kribbella amoyensis]TWD83924.1 tRNA G18 (ribose-2'-O)-methylase SpoU [Kribbella amoyensis]
MIVPVEAADDPRLADYVQLREVNLRRLLEEEHGLFIAEGDKVIRRAGEAGYEPRSFLLAPRWLDSLADVLAKWPDVPVYVVTEELAEQVTGFHVHRGALASYRRQPPADLGALLDGVRHGRLAIFDDIVDHTNVGAGFRAAAAMGVDAVLVTPTCADPLYRRSVKVSMGTVFQVPWTRLTSWPGDLDVLQDHGFVTAAFALTDDSITLDDLAARRDDKLALIFGTEGHGLKPNVLRRADLTVRIPMAGGVDSLNVASSAAVAFYATRP